MYDEPDAGLNKPNHPLKRGWTTGACATAATKAALTALLTGEFPDPVSIVLPKGETPSFSLSFEKLGDSEAHAGIIKDAGDDPDVTHGAMIIAKVTRGKSGCGIMFNAGSGVGIITKAGLPLSVGEAAINPIPRTLMRDVVTQLCTLHHVSCDIEITISVPNGQELARKTWNPRLGIMGGISILGTTGIVHPFSCAAWIHSIHRGVDVARAQGLTHIAGSTGSTSEDAVQKFYQLQDSSLIDMGDFAGGLLKYVRMHPVAKLTIAGGFAKITKLAQGHMDLHSSRSQIDFAFLHQLALHHGLVPALAEQTLTANTAQEVLEITNSYGVNLAHIIALLAKQQAQLILRDAPVEVEIFITNRKGDMIACL
jgi:cobalt-precorrin-5B (C1)-methyltransferase